MFIFVFLTVFQAIIAAALVGVILMQKSEGGGLGIGGGGNPNGMMSARGAADFLTRATRWLAVTFVILSIALAAVAVETGTADEVVSTIDRSVTPQDDPLADVLDGDPAAPGGAAPAPQGDIDPLAQQPE